MTPSEQHKRNELDNCIRKYNESGDMNAFKRANELRAELGMEQVEVIKSLLSLTEVSVTSSGQPGITIKRGKKK